MQTSRWKKLSPGRILVSDITTIANRIPFIPLVREFDLPELDRLRRQVRPRISWTAMMIKAYAVVARQRPELRQSYMSRPYAHIYEHPRNIAQVAITRQVDGESRLFFARFCDPDVRSLTDLQGHYEYYRHAPIAEIKHFRHQIHFARMPSFIRIPVWRLLTDWWGSKRAKNLGTFGMSLSRGMYDTKGLFHLAPTTTVLGYELLPERGKSRITMTFDHRVLDGAPATDILEQVCRTLRSDIASELKKLALETNNATAPTTQDQNESFRELSSCEDTADVPAIATPPPARKSA